ncbi:MAG: hypothetical protein JRI54_11665, partial [Deltaproteobacteria bacterium]|nr:hypothetical protein [Deltaproteobacteria bacterium]
MKKLFYVLGIVAFVGLGYAGTTHFSNLSVAGDVAAGDDLTVTDDASVGGDLDVTGDVSISGNNLDLGSANIDYDSSDYEVDFDTSVKFSVK